MKRTEAEIQTQIEELTAIKLKPTFRRTTLFGDNNVEAIEAQIEVLEERLTDDDVTDRQDMEDFSEHAANSALDAANWLAGVDEDTPVKGWEGLY